MADRFPRIAPSPLAFVTRADEALTHIRARSGPSLAKVRPGIYVDRSGWNSLKPWERYLVRVHAFAYTHPGVVFCLESAAVLLGLPIFGEPVDIHVIGAAGLRSRRVGDVLVHSAVDERPTVANGWCTSVAATAIDLVRVLPPAYALAVADAALRRPDGATSADALRDLAADQSTRRGRARLEWVLPRATGAAESVGESISRAVVEWCGFPEPELQQWFSAEGFDDRVDFFWRRWRVIGESDGYGKYSASANRDVMDALRKEKTREDRLRRQVDRIARWDWADAIRATPLERKLVTAGIPQPFPRREALLATLRSHPRSL